MRTRSRVARGAGVTLAEVVVAVLVIAVLASLMLPKCEPERGRLYWLRCRMNLNQIAKGMATYLNECGDNRWYPCPLGRGATPDNYNGAEWLASHYWTRIVSDPRVFLCNISGDQNEGGGATWH